MITIAFAVALWPIVAWAAIRGALVPSTLHSHLRR